MKYYAVTDDPNELMHFGIKGMRWGIRRTDAQLGHPRHTGSRRPRSAAYKKASAKLSSAMRNGINKVKANWRAYNSPQAKEKRFMDKAMQQARNGTLKYGKLTDAQVQKITDRLYLERQARQLGSTEQPRYSKRLKMAIGAGIVQGIGMGTASYINARFEGRGKTTAEIKRDKRMAKYEGREDVQRRRAINKQNEEFYKTTAEEGVNPYNWRYTTSKQRAKYLSDVKERNKLSDIKKNQREKRDNAYYTALGKSMGEAEAKRPVYVPRPYTGRGLPSPATSSHDVAMVIDEHGVAHYPKRRGKFKGGS